MTTRTRHTAAVGTAAVLAAVVLFCAQAATAETLAPLPPSAYTARAVCPPPSSGHAACLALALVARTAQARAHTHPLGVARSAPRSVPSPAAGDFGLRPQDVHSAYQLPTSAPTAQKIALVDAYNDPAAEADLKVYDEEFGLPECTAGDGCFTQVNELGETGKPPFPKTTQELEAAHGGSASEREEAAEAEGWGLEMSLDIEVAHATCQSCKIMLVESDSTSDQDLETAEQTAAALGAEEISNSWGGPECVEVSHVRECVPESPAFNHPGIVITASAGDTGYLSWDSSEKGFAEFPASSPSVVAVGGTRLLLAGAGKWAGETVWNDGGEDKGVNDGYGAGGGGCSVNFEAQPWQQSVSDWSAVGCGDRRAVADVSADADPYTGFAVYDSSGACETRYEEEDEEEEIVEQAVHWCTIGGTSLASPLVASTFALAGGAHQVEYPARTLYENEALSPSSLHDVTAGSNGACKLPFDGDTGQSGCTASEEAAASCSSQLICSAGAGYDGPTGVGTPDGIAAFQPPAEGGGQGPTGSGEAGKGTGGESPAPKGGGSDGSSSVSPASSAGSPSGATAAASAAQTSVRLTGLALTANALIALNTSRPRILQLGFTFTINVAARVRASLQERVRRHGHTRWQALAHPLTIAASSGRNTRRFGGHETLSSGTYRLTLTPVHGAERSIVFEIG
jgi:Subtilase family